MRLDEQQVRRRAAGTAGSHPPAQVVAIHGLGIEDSFEIAAVTPDEIAASAVAAPTGVELDLVFGSCTNIRGMEALPPIESALVLPAISSNQAAIEAILTELVNPHAEWVPVSGP